jgi:hypothetical protein
MSWRSVILVEEAGGPGENHRPFARGYYNYNQGVAFMITFLLFIEYVYLKTGKYPDATLTEQ